MVEKNKLISKLFKYKLVRFSICGGLATLIDWTLFYFLAIKLMIYYQLSLIISFSLSAFVNYSINKLFTFRCRSKKIFRQILLFYFIVMISLLYSMFFMFVFVDLLLWDKMLSRIFTTFITLILNYIMHSNLTFNKKFFNY